MVPMTYVCRAETIDDAIEALNLDLPEIVNCELEKVGLKPTSKDWDSNVYVDESQFEIVEITKDTTPQEIEDFSKYSLDTQISCMVENIDLTLGQALSEL